MVLILKYSDTIKKKKPAMKIASDVPDSGIETGNMNTRTLHYAFLLQFFSQIFLT